MQRKEILQLRWTVVQIFTCEVAGSEDKGEYRLHVNRASLYLTTQGRIWWIFLIIILYYYQREMKKSWRSNNFVSISKDQGVFFFFFLSKRVPLWEKKWQFCGKMGKMKLSLWTPGKSLGPHVGTKQRT